MRISACFRTRPPPPASPIGDGVANVNHFGLAAEAIKACALLADLTFGLTAEYTYLASTKGRGSAIGNGAANAKGFGSGQICPRAPAWRAVNIHRRRLAVLDFFQ